MSPSLTLGDFKERKIENIYKEKDRERGTDT
jgi:hypothetical protein